MAQQVPLPEQAGKDEETSCQHHWVIQAATGPVSPGVCQTCGETREFKNYVEASTWGADKSASKTNAAAAPKSAPKPNNEENEGNEDNGD